MANTYTSLHFHVVFSTKNRQRCIRQEIETRIWAYLGGIARENGFKALLVGGVEDHVHVLLGVPPLLALSKAVQLLKGASSKWIKENITDLRGFGWQDGYAAFTVSKSDIAEVEAYIKSQREHHRRKSFEEEYRSFLDRHGIQYDERYLFDGEVVG
jgi:putative transposase